METPTGPPPGPPFEQRTREGEIAADEPTADTPRQQQEEEESAAEWQDGDTRYWPEESDDDEPIYMNIPSRPNRSSDEDIVGDAEPEPADMRAAMKGLYKSLKSSSRKKKKERGKGEQGRRYP